MPDTTTFGALLRRHRLAAALSQQALAERARLSVDAIAALERGRRKAPRPETLTLLSGALDLTPAERAAFIAKGSGGAAPKSLDEPPSRRSFTPQSPVLLPCPPDGLIGREREKTEVVRLLRRGASRLITLTGPGGVGKTRLALAAASAVNGDFDDAIFVDLSALREPVLLPSTILQSVGLHEAGDREARDVLLEALRQRRLLLVLDNFEHLLGAVPFLSDLLAACPLLVALVTSRVALQARAEQRYRVSPLATPDPDATRFEEIASCASVRLFVARAMAVQPEFSLTARNSAAIGAVCARLDGLPLAIELAAARVALLSPAMLLARLNRRLPLLVGGSRDLPDRQRTLRATIDWSYNLLDVEQQRLFRSLAVFVGGCTLEAAEAVHQPGPNSDGDILGGVEALVVASLLRRETRSDGEPRLMMLETIREYALERLTAAGEEAEWRDRHASVYLALGTTVGSRLSDSWEEAPLMRLGPELENLRQALAWFEEQGQVAPALRLAADLRLFWAARGLFAEGSSRLQALLAAGQAVDPALRAAALGAVAWLIQHQGRAPAGQRWYAEALAIYEQMGDEPAIADTASALGLGAREQGDLAEARAWFLQSLERYERLGNRGGSATQRDRLGTVAQLLGDFAAAERLYGESSAVLRAINHPFLAWSLHNQASLALERGLPAVAAPLLEASLGGFRALGYRYALVDSLALCASLAAAEGQWERALRLLGAVDALNATMERRLPRLEQRAVDRWVAVAPRMLTAVATSAARRAGAELSLEQAVAAAFAPVSRSAGTPSGKPGLA